MNALTTAVVSYVIATGISLLVAGLIQLMVVAISRLPQKSSELSPVVTLAPVEKRASDEAAIVAVIAIAKSY